MKHEPEPPKPMEWREAVELILRLAAIPDVSTIREGDRLNLIDDIRHFLEVEGDGQLADTLARARTEPPILKDTVDRVRKLVEAVADHTEVQFNLGKSKLVFDGSRLGGRNAIAWDSELADAVLQTAADDLSEAEPWQVCRCQESECGKLFLAGRKGQRYCSHACANKGAERTYREKNKDQRKEKERARYRAKKKPTAPGKEK